MQAETSPKSRLAAGLLCFFFGWLGVHRFYVGKVGTAILMVMTFGGFGIWATIDLIFIIVGAFRDAEGRLLRRWEEPQEAPRAVGPMTFESMYERRKANGTAENSQTSVDPGSTE